MENPSVEVEKENHMLVQAKDCMDVWNCLTRTGYLLPFWEFDHSSRHDSEREDGLTTSPAHLKMSWGKGKKFERAGTDGCLCWYNRTQRPSLPRLYSLSQLSPIRQTSRFFYSNEPPPEHEIVLERNSEKKVKNKDDLRRDLDAAGINSKGNVPILKERCRQARISLEKNLDKLIPGFVGKPKGALQISYERGLIDANKKNAGGKIASWEGSIIKDTSDNNRAQKVPGSHRHDQHQGQARKKKPKKRRDLSTSLRSIMSNFEDFKNEKSKLECLVEELGGNCHMTPKVHPEIAGVGIEYNWGYAKLKYRKEINDGIASHLEENVKKALSPESTLTISRTRKFARKAREYKLTYFFLISMLTQTDSTCGGDEQLAKETIKSITKAFKAHGCALDSNYAFTRTA
jgi:hypothetical protein